MRFRPQLRRERLELLSNKFLPVHGRVIEELMEYTEYVAESAEREY